MKKPNLLKNMNWPTALFLILTPISALILVPTYLILNEWNWWIAFLFIFFYVMTTMSITAGYHRLLAHRAYQANPLLKSFFLLVGGPAAFQGSALEWCSDHRRHHQYVDTENDPYNIKNGFFFAHIGWMLKKTSPQKKAAFGRDLLNDKLVVWQHNNYMWLAIANCFLAPLLIGFTFGAPFGAFIFAGVTRLVLAHHATFFINSLCHTFGRQTYQKENTARDSLILSILTQGEGLHNFHHKFASDYRNGVRWYDWDPTKWFIRTMNGVGLAKQLKKIPPSQIFKARLEMDHQVLLLKGVPQEKLLMLKTRLEEAQDRFRELKARYKILKRQWHSSQREHLKALKMEYRNAKIEFRMMLAQWQSLRQLQTV